MALIQRCILTAAISVAALIGPASAEPIHVKVGVLNDMSGVYSDTGGKGSVVAAQMAVEDFAKTN
ncbi:MAG: ABC transporter permease, partial [Parafilimonas terrae]|nr:ABC transporter permease [Parafilimonas terrae]